MTFESVYIPVLLIRDVQARGLCEGDVVTHIDGEPLLGSLKAGHSLIEQAGDSLALRIQSGDGSHAGPGTPKKAKFSVVQHTVRQGDSIKALAKLYGVTADEVRLWNRKYFPVGEPGFLCPGQVLTLRDTAAHEAGDGRKTSSKQTIQDSSASRRKSGGDGGRKRMLYQVREGDSLKTICAHFKLKEGEVRGLNRNVFPIGEPGVVCPGQLLTVFAEDCDSLISDGGSENSAVDESEQAFMQSFTGRETRRSIFSVRMRGAGVIG